MARKLMLMVLLLCLPLMAQHSEHRTSGAKQALTLLKTEAAKRNLRWRVFCSPIQEGFIGWAIQPGAEYAAYVEDGAKPDWWVTGSTQESALRALYVAILRGPNSYPRHKEPERKKQCPPELTEASK